MLFAVGSLGAGHKDLPAGADGNTIPAVEKRETNREIELAAITSGKTRHRACRPTQHFSKSLNGWHGVVIGHDVIAQWLPSGDRDGGRQASPLAGARTSDGGKPGPHFGGARGDAKTNLAEQIEPRFLAAAQLSQRSATSSQRSENDAMTFSMTCADVSSASHAFPTRAAERPAPRTLRVARWTRMPPPEFEDSAKAMGCPPADAEVPGAHFCNCQERSIAEGERLQVCAPAGTAVAGV